jgi:p-aminobenzoyl-glutamate transporter AbgT
LFLQKKYKRSISKKAVNVPDKGGNGIPSFKTLFAILCVILQEHFPTGPFLPGTKPAYG